MRRYTDFSTYDEFFKAGGFEFETQEEFDATPDEQFDEHVSKTTKFSSWQDMKQKGWGALHRTQIKGHQVI